MAGTDGQAVIGAIISLYNIDSPTTAASVDSVELYRATTDTRGRFLIADLPPANYTLQVQHQSYKLPPRMNVPLKQGGAEDVGTLRLERDAARFGSITGTVVDDTGQPIANAIARLEPSAVEGQRTSSDGRFKLADVLPGEYLLTIAATGYRPAIIPVVVDDSPNFAVNFSAGIKLSKGTGNSDIPVIVDSIQASPSVKEESAPVASATTQLPTNTAAPVTSASSTLSLPSATPQDPATPVPIATASTTTTAAQPLSLVGPPAIETLVGRVFSYAGKSRGFADGTLSTAQFDSPRGITVTAEGTVYVADTNNHCIRKITADGLVSTFAGGTQGFADGRGSAARFNKPSGIAIGPDGRLYVTDRVNHRIRTITPEGEVTTLAGSTFGFLDGPGLEAKFYEPYDLVVAPSGVIFVADTHTNRIRKITPDGQVSTLAGTSQWGLADGIGSAAQFKTLVGIDLMQNGNLVVADDHRVRVVTPAGDVSTLAGSTDGYADDTGNLAMFNQIQDVAAGRDGSIYVADGVNTRIRKITPDGKVTTLAGSSISGSSDGLGVQAQFSRPAGLSFSPNGSLLVTQFHRIRLIQ